MKNKLIALVALVSVVLLIFMIRIIRNQSDVARANKFLHIGGDIYTAKRNLEEEGMKVGNIESLTKSGDLSMGITIKEFEPNFLDDIGYASAPHVNLQPWKELEINYILVEADKRGKIYRITPR